MNLLFDQNISPRILKELPSQFAACQQVRFVGLENSSDLEIFQYAKREGYAVVTFDADFVDLNAIYGTPPSIVYLNTGNLTTKNVSVLLSDNIEKIAEYLNENGDGILELVN